MQGLAEVYKGLRKFELAVPLFEETLQLRKAQGGSNDVATHFCMEDLGFCYYSIRRYDKSIPLFEELLLSAEKKVGRKHEFTLKQIGNLGWNYVSAGRLAEGIPLLEENYLVSKTLSIQSPYGSSLLVAYDQAGKTAEAMKLAAELLSDSRKELPKDSTELSNVLAACGDRLLKVKEYVEAEPLLREALVIREKTQPDAWNTFNTQSLLGGALLRQKKYADAEPLLVKGYEGMKAREKTIPKGGEIRIPDALGRLVELYTAWHATEPDKGYDAKAAEWQKKLDEHNTAGEKATPPVTPEK